jgi:hypothetical protein
METWHRKTVYLMVLGSKKIGRGKARVLPSFSRAHPQ